jgi:hypothetical protein
MTALHAAYFDASGEPAGYPVLTIGGAVAPVKKWERFERKWLSILRSEGIEEFHATDFAASRGEFKGWKGDTKRRSHFLGDLGKTIKENVNKLFMVNIEIDAWNEINRDYLLEEVLYNPYALCGYTVIREGLAWSKSKRIKSPVKFIFEDGDDGWAGLVKLASRSKIVPIRLPKSVAIPCQAADLIAWKSRIAFTNSLQRLGKIETAQYADFENFKGILDEWSSLEKMLVRPGKPGVYGREALLRTCKNSGIITRAQFLDISIRF